MGEYTKLRGTPDYKATNWRNRTTKGEKGDPLKKEDW